MSGSSNSSLLTTAPASCSAGCNGLQYVTEQCKVDLCGYVRRGVNCCEANGGAIAGVVILIIVAIAGAIAGVGAWFYVRKKSRKKKKRKELEDAEQEQRRLKQPTLTNKKAGTAGSGDQPVHHHNTYVVVGLTTTDLENGDGGVQEDEAGIFRAAAQNDMLSDDDDQYEDGDESSDDEDQERDENGDIILRKRLQGPYANGATMQQTTKFGHRAWSSVPQESKKIRPTLQIKPVDPFYVNEDLLTPEIVLSSGESGKTPPRGVKADKQNEKEEEVEYIPWHLKGGGQRVENVAAPRHLEEQVDAFRDLSADNTNTTAAPNKYAFPSEFGNEGPPMYDDEAAAGGGYNYAKPVSADAPATEEIVAPAGKLSRGSIMYMATLEPYDEQDLFENSVEEGGQTSSGKKQSPRPPQLQPLHTKTPPPQEQERSGGVEESNTFVSTDVHAVPVEPRITEVKAEVISTSVATAPAVAPTVTTPTDTAAPTIPVVVSSPADAKKRKKQLGKQLNAWKTQYQEEHGKAPTTKEIRKSEEIGPIYEEWKALDGESKQHGTEGEGAEGPPPPSASTRTQPPQEEPPQEQPRDLLSPADAKKRKKQLGKQLNAWKAQYQEEHGKAPTTKEIRKSEEIGPVYEEWKALDTDKKAKDEGDESGGGNADAVAAPSLSEPTTISAPIPSTPALTTSSPASHSETPALTVDPKKRKKQLGKQLNAWKTQYQEEHGKAPTTKEIRKSEEIGPVYEEWKALQKDQEEKE